MTFLELQKQIVQTRKARKGIKNRTDYFDSDSNEDFYVAVYKKALSVANKVVQHYEEAREINPKEKVSVGFKSK